MDLDRIDLALVYADSTPFGLRSTQVDLGS